MTASYLVHNWQPVTGLLLGGLILGFYYYLQIKWKGCIVPWIARHVFRNPNMVASATSFFNVVSSFVFLVGGIWIVAALYYLGNG